MKENNPFFLAFLIFDSILGLNGLAFIGEAIYLMITIKFNSILFLMIDIGIIIFLIFIFGIKIQKSHLLLTIYLSFVIIIFLFCIFLSIIVKGFPDKLINYLKSKVNDINNEEFEKIIKKNIYLFIIACSGVCSSIFVFIIGIIYYKKMKIKNKRKKKNLIQGYGEDAMHGIDYSTSREDDKNNDTLN